MKFLEFFRRWLYQRRARELSVVEARMYLPSWKEACPYNHWFARLIARFDQVSFDMDKQRAKKLRQKLGFEPEGGA